MQREATLIASAQTCQKYFPGVGRHNNKTNVQPTVVIIGVTWFYLILWTHACIFHSTLSPLLLTFFTQTSKLAWL